MALKTYRLRDSVFSTLELESETVEPGDATGTPDTLRTWTLTTAEGFAFTLRSKKLGWEVAVDAHLRCPSCGSTILDAGVCATCAPLFTAEHSADLETHWVRLYSTQHPTRTAYLDHHSEAIAGVLESWLRLQTNADPLTAVVAANAILAELPSLLELIFEEGETA